MVQKRKKSKNMYEQRIDLWCKPTSTITGEQLIALLIVAAPVTILS